MRRGGSPRTSRSCRSYYEKRGKPAELGPRVGPRANLSKVNLSRANLSEANLGGADLGGADLGGADLQGSRLVNVNLTDADLTGCRIYGVSTWGLKLERAKQQNLVITPMNEPEITVDNIEVAQFIYLMLRPSCSARMRRELSGTIHMQRLQNPDSIRDANSHVRN
jgi:Pentapeptide repeats (8 copies)